MYFSDKRNNMAKVIHKHCEGCYSVHCRAPVNLSISCLVIKCSKNCGATFHMCKQEEHQILCPYEIVPCLNMDFGCPLTMPRQKLAKHLEVCPASTVCCSQEWNRWPVPETDITFYKNVSGNLKLKTDENLDVALALRDQALLFQSIKMKNIFPEMMKEDPASENMSDGVKSHVEDASCLLDFSESTENGTAEVEDRGMVLLEWKKKTYSHGGSSWKSRKKIWRFSSLFSTVDRWSFSNVPSMSEHLKSCPFYQREELREPVALACLEEVREKHGELKHIR
ncbi:PREDICTED: F-box only protein 40 isoform X2 [Cyprinodon variegatus]|uniref:F-box only protein 40 isoform X2 n=1 Tax=Cyprinodon variegatus TaxID=28743 RepID=UPI000742B1B7|nr:PREDICTED: F-box only protein 40 isoform X2 [Cyprinodon variegatus]